MKPISIKRIAIMLLLALPVVYLAACVFLFFTQRSLLYSPPAVSISTNDPVLLIESEGETLRVLTKSADSSEAIILFGGNADDVSGYLRPLGTALPGQNLFLVNYRGYGGSTGTPSEAALFADAEAVYDRVREKYTNITVIGRSLGSGVAVYLASVRKVEKLVLITPYDSIENVAESQFPIFPIGLLLKDRFGSASRVKDVTARTLILIAENDRTIPRENSDVLVRRFPADQVVVKVLAGKSHASISSGPEYLNLLSEFLSPATK